MAIDYTQLKSGQQYLPLLASAARTVTPNQQEVSALNCDVDCLIVVLNMTAVTTTGTVTVKIEGVDPQTDAVYPILTGTTVSATGVTVLRVHPNLPLVANATAQDVVPPVFRITATHGAAAVAMTYSLTALIPD